MIRKIPEYKITKRKTKPEVVLTIIVCQIRAKFSKNNFAPSFPKTKAVNQLRKRQKKNFTGKNNWIFPKRKRKLKIAIVKKLKKVATAAPTIPKDGIKRRFKIMFKKAAARVIFIPIFG